MSILSFIHVNYFTLLMMVSLAVVMVVNDDARLPEVRIIWWIITALLIVMVEQYLYEWAILDPNRYYAAWACASVDYILYPIVILMYVVMVTPAPTRRVLVLIPAILNTEVVLFGPWVGLPVFTISLRPYAFVPGPLRGIPFLVAGVYLILLLMALQHTYPLQQKRYAAIAIWLVGSTMVTCLLQFFEVVTGFFDEMAVLDLTLYYLFVFAIDRERVQNALSERELELTHTRVRLMREQIRPHFVFNSLAIVRALIFQDQDRAAECLDDFSLYLQRNLQSLRSDELVSFEAELEHIRAFLRLALVDDTRNVQVKYDLQATNFRLPALTVEPCVENAIRHGLARQKGMNLLEIISREDPEQYVIIVRDNGVGFDVSTLREKRSQGVGIESTRTRLRLQCGGNLDIRSGETGTTVTIRIPKAGIALAEKENGQ